MRFVCDELINLRKYLKGSNTKSNDGNIVKNDNKMLRNITEEFFSGTFLAYRIRYYAITVIHAFSINELK